MNKDELINRVVLLGSTLSQAVRDGETTHAIIKDIDLDTLREAASYFGTVISEPKTFAPYYYFSHSPSMFAYVEVRGKELKEVTTVTYE